MGKFTGHSITSDSALGSAVIERSLKFNRGDAPYLQATLGDGNEDKWTWSGWVKKTVNGQHQNLFSSGSDAVYTHINFDNSDRIRFQNWHSAQKGTKITTRKIRDLSSWMHIVIIWDSGNATADDRMRIYVNGTRETAFDDSTNPDQNQDSVINGNSIGGSTYGNGKQYIGKFADTSDNSGTYQTEINFVDGQTYDASYFGFTDSQTGIWMPKRYEGTYGTNGFYLDFSDNSSTSTLGIDKSPNGNDFTANNFSVSAGAGNDSVEDTPTNNFCTMNPLDMHDSLSTKNGNLQVGEGNDWRGIKGTFGVSSGKWYYEFKTGNANIFCGWASDDLTGTNNITTNPQDSNSAMSAGVLIFCDDGRYHLDTGGSGNRVSYSSALSANDVLGCAIDLDNNTAQFYKQGSALGSIDISSSKLATKRVLPYFISHPFDDPDYTFNFGQQAFAYTPPTGFKTLCSRNLPPNNPSIVRPQKHFTTVLYTGSGSSRTIDCGFAADFVWCKSRSVVGGQHFLSDSVRGHGKLLQAESTGAEYDADGNGISANGAQWGGGVGVNGNGSTYVNWFWKAGGAAVTNNDGSIASQVSANQQAGFSICTWTGTGSNLSFGHGLGKKPDWVITKARTGSSGCDWYVYHKEIGATHNLRLNGTSASGASSDLFNNTEPTSSVFSIGNSSCINENGGTYLSYCWAEIPGYSKFGKYTGNGSTDGTYVHLGFRPAFILLKATDSTRNWVLIDNKRSAVSGANQNDYTLEANNANAEYTNGAVASIDNDSDGFKFRGSAADSNNSGTNYIYIAFAEQPGPTPFDTFPNAR